MRITKAEWTQRGGLRNPRCYRKADSLGRWRYYWSGDYV